LIPNFELPDIRLLPVACSTAATTNPDDQRTDLDVFSTFTAAADDATIQANGTAGFPSARWLALAAYAGQYESGYGRNTAPRELVLPGPATILFVVSHGGTANTTNRVCGKLRVIGRRRIPLARPALAWRPLHPHHIHAVVVGYRRTLSSTDDRAASRRLCTGAMIRLALHSPVTRRFQPSDALKRWPGKWR
jgi:hypothetical protein